jgi:hypothetical protein
MTQRETLKIVKRGSQALIIKRRVPCLGPCGTMVSRGQGECRQCRRTRIRVGLKRLKKAGV